MKPRTILFAAVIAAIPSVGYPALVTDNSPRSVVHFALSVSYHCSEITGDPRIYLAMIEDAKRHLSVRAINTIRLKVERHSRPPRIVTAAFCRGARIVR